MDFEVVLFVFNFVYDMLPIGSEDVLVLSL